MVTTYLFLGWFIFVCINHSAAALFTFGNEHLARQNKQTARRRRTNDAYYETEDIEMTLWLKHILEF